MSQSLPPADPAIARSFAGELETNPGDVSVANVERLREEGLIAAEVLNNIGKADRRNSASDERALRLQMEADGREQWRAS